MGLSSSLCIKVLIDASDTSDSPDRSFLFLNIGPTQVYLAVSERYTAFSAGLFYLLVLTERALLRTRATHSNNHPPMRTTSLYIKTPYLYMRLTVIPNRPTFLALDYSASVLPTVHRYGKSRIPTSSEDSCWRQQQHRRLHLRQLQPRHDDQR